MALMQQPCDSCFICNRMLVINKDVKLCYELIQYNLSNGSGKARKVLHYHTMSNTINDIFINT